MTDDEQLLAANEAFYRAFNQRDIGAMDVIWSHSSPVTCIHPGWNLLTGRIEVLMSWEAILSNPDNSRLIAGGATAHIHGDCSYVICRELSGGSALLATNVFVREDGRWRMTHHQSGPVAIQSVS